MKLSELKEKIGYTMPAGEGECASNWYVILPDIAEKGVKELELTSKEFYFCLKTNIEEFFVSALKNFQENKAIELDNIEILGIKISLIK